MRTSAKLSKMRDSAESTVLDARQFQPAETNGMDGFADVATYSALHISASEDSGNLWTVGVDTLERTPCFSSAKYKRIEGVSYLSSF